MPASIIPSGPGAKGIPLGVPSDHFREFLEGEVVEAKPKKKAAKVKK